MTAEVIMHTLIVKRGPDFEQDYAAGDLTDVYRLETPAQYRLAAPEDALADAHHLPLPEDFDHAREVNVHRCRCRGGMGAKLVIVRACADGRLWAEIQPDRLPSSRAVTAEETGPKQSLAAPLHVDIDGRPHAEVTCCRKCNLRWLVLLYALEVELHAIAEVAYGVRVAE